MSTLTLADHIRDCKPLNDAQIMGIIKLIGKHCRRETVRKLEGRLKFAHIQQNYGIYSRLTVFPEVRYCTGQSFPDEMATIRKCLLG